jgi:hypothetical protein
MYSVVMYSSLHTGKNTLLLYHQLYNAGLSLTGSGERAAFGM